MNQDSIKLPDSLKHQTLLSKRTVYGGGGIMPDYFVPLDTSEITDYFTALVRAGYVNNFELEYVDKKRETILEKYPQFDDFKQTFTLDKSFMDAFFDYVKEQDAELEFNKEEYKTSESLLKLRLKASLANDLWGFQQFYEIYNESNEILQKAIEIIESDKYEQYGLSEIN